MFLYCIEGDDTNLTGSGMQNETYIQYPNIQLTKETSHRNQSFTSPAPSLVTSNVRNPVVMPSHNESSTVVDNTTQNLLIEFTTPNLMEGEVSTRVLFNKSATDEETSISSNSTTSLPSKVVNVKVASKGISTFF